MILWRMPLALLVIATVAACGGGGGAMRCENSSIYATSVSAAPVRVPDDLSVPDESQALQIPPGEALPPKAKDEPPDCLERPPDFFDEETPSG
jgi:uncharacterized lipoprotein